MVNNPNTGQNAFHGFISFPFFLSSFFSFSFLSFFPQVILPLIPPHSCACQWLGLAVMDDKASVGKISVSSDSVSTINSEDFVLVSRLGDETPSSTNNGSDDEKTGLKVRLTSGPREMRGGPPRRRGAALGPAQPTVLFTYGLLWPDGDDGLLSPSSTHRLIG